MDLLTNFHEPVLLEELRTAVLQKKSGVYFDGTLGFGGHARSFLKDLGEDAIYIATDVDDYAFDYCKEQFQNDNRVRIYKYNFVRIDAIAKIEGVAGFDGIIADLGVSSYQLDEPSAGFTFRADAPIDMRMDKSLEKTAKDILNQESEEYLVEIFFKYGEEKASRKIARKIIEKRSEAEFKSTEDLMQIIRQIAPIPYQTKTAQRIFQALRIAVNEELHNLEMFLEKAISTLMPGGRIGVISYHSLEDRIVKEVFRYQEKECICPPGLPICVCDKVRTLKVLTRRHVAASDAEISSNKRARSAKLRIAERV